MLSVRIDTHVVNFVMMCNYNNLLSLFFFLFLRRRFDFQSPSRMDRNVELFLNIEKALKEVQYIEKQMLFCLFWLNII